MSASASAPLPDEAALIVFGTGKYLGKPQAAWFRADDAAIAFWVAEQLGFSVIAVAAARQHGTALPLTEWQLGRDAHPTIPLVSPATLTALQELQKAPGAVPPSPPAATARSETAQATRASIDQLWGALTVKSVVLAPELDNDGLPEGWWEAVILAVHEDSYTLCWRDFPEQGLIQRPKCHLALLYPPA